MWHWRPIRRDNGVKLSTESPRGWGEFEPTVLPTLAAGQTGRVLIELTFDEYSTTRQIIAASSNNFNALRVFEDLQQAFLTDNAGASLGVVDISSLGYVVGRRDYLEIVATRNGGGTATDYTLGNNRGQSVSLATGVATTYQWRYIQSSNGGFGSGFTVWSIETDYPGDQRIYRVNEGRGTQSYADATNYIEWANVRWLTPNTKLYNTGGTKYRRATPFADRMS